MFFINYLSVEIDNSVDFETDTDSDNNTTSWNGVDLDDTELEELSSDIEDYKGNNYLINKLSVVASSKLDGDDAYEVIMTDDIDSLITTPKRPVTRSQRKALRV